MTEEQWWALWITTPALVASVPFYLASTAYFAWCREGFAEFLAFVDAFDGLPDHETEPM